MVLKLLTEKIDVDERALSKAEGVMLLRIVDVSFAFAFAMF
jgi:hypothetical protein